MVLRELSSKVGVRVSIAAALFVDDGRSEVGVYGWCSVTPRETAVDRRNLLRRRGSLIQFLVNQLCDKERKRLTLEQLFPPN